MSSRTSTNADELLQHVGWVRALARRLEHDADAAEDLAQDAFIVALSSTRPTEAPVRRWLAVVLHNLSRSARRANRRRRTREDAVRRPDESVDTFDLVERAVSQRALVDAVLALEEPYRTTLLERYFEELSNEQIARRGGVSASTVATRLQRGITRLRARLDAQDGRRGRMAALLPLARWRSETALPISSQLASALLMATSTKFLAAAAVLAGLVGFLYLRSPEAESLDALTAATGSGAEAQLDELLVNAPAARAEIEKETAAVTTVVAARSGLPAGHPPIDRAWRNTTALLRGVVVDAQGLRLSGLEVARLAADAQALQGVTVLEFDGESPVLVTDAEGRFEIEADRGQLFAVRSDAWANIVVAGLAMSPFSDPEPGAEARAIVVAPKMPVAGLVVDQDGAAIEGAILHFVHPDSAFRDVGALFGSGWQRPLNALTDALGRFEFSDIGDIDGSRIRVRALGYPAIWVGVTAGGDGALRIVLEHPPGGSTAIAGRVLHADGRPATDAWVSAGQATGRTDADGYFVVESAGLMPPKLGSSGPTSETPITLAAVAESGGSARLVLPPSAQRDTWPDPIVLLLTEHDLSLSGRVVDEAGNPLELVGVRLADPSPFGWFEVAPGASGFQYKSLEDVVSGSDEVRTDADGNFVLRGLVDRDYRVEANLPLAMLRVETKPLRAGTSGIELVLDRNILGRLAGHVVDSAGAPVPGVTVMAGRRESANRMGGFALGTPVVTDADGEFALENIAPEGLTLRLTGDAIVPEIGRALPEGSDLEDLVLTVGRRCQLVFEWGEWGGRADTARLFDGQGAIVPMANVGANGFGLRDEVIVGSGTSRLLVASDATASAVLFKGEEEVARVAVRLVPGELVTVSF
ncbi:MAG: sigma-70 family RNA polymerase sigma factor [bacterium]|nr:sigma-70 family RNA polymerase sigma factor [bacterium]